LQETFVMRTNLKTFACALFAFLAIGAWAAGEVELSSLVQKLETYVDENGEEQTRLVEAASVVPGDELRYTILFENVSDSVTVDAGSVVITNPVPEFTEYVEGTAFGAGTVIEFSADGGETWGDPGSLTVIDEGGERLAEPADYTHVRWTLQPELEPGAQGSVYFRVKLL
jgi:uncharacterized repeat protein (TIGR01451 family)